MGPELVTLNRRLHRMIRYVPDFLLRPLARGASGAFPARITAAAIEAMEPDKGLQARDALTDVAAIRDFYQDEIWSDAFWDEVLFECPDRTSTTDGNSGGPGEGDEIDLARFLSARPAHMFSFRPEQMERFIRHGAIPCPECHRRHPVVSAAPRYLWAPLRGGQTRTATLTGLQRLDTYVALPDRAA